MRAKLRCSVAQNGVNSSTLSRSNVAVVRVGGGFSEVLFCTATECEFCESLELVCNLELRYLIGGPVEVVQDVPKSRVATLRDLLLCASLVL